MSDGIQGLPSVAGPVRPAPTHRRAQQVWWVLIATLVVVGAAVGSRPRRGADFRVYLTAAERFTAGEDLYREADGKMPFKYAPASAALFAPFTLLDRRAAVAVWNALSVAALIAAGHLASSIFRRFGPTRPWPWAAVVATAALLPALAFEMFYSQVDVAQMVLILLAADGAERGRRWGPGLALTTAVLLKPPAIVVGLYFLVRRKWGVIGAGLVTTAAAMGLVALRYGPSGALEQTRAWLELLGRTTAPWALNPNAQGLPTLITAVANVVGVPPDPGMMVISQVAALLIFLAAVAWARPSPPALLAASCLAVAWLSPQAWRANYVLAWPLALLAAETRTVWTLATLGGVAAVGVVASGVSVTPTVATLLAPRPFAIAYAALLAAVLWHHRSAASRLPDSALEAP